MSAPPHKGLESRFGKGACLPLARRGEQAGFAPALSNSQRLRYCAALVHESVRGAHGTFWRLNLLPDDHVALRLAQLSHPVQYVAPDHRLPLLRFVAARAKAVSERALLPKEKILDGALSTIP